MDSVVNKEGGMSSNISVHGLLNVIADAVISNEATLTELDSALGDGDCGVGMKQGFSSVKNEIKDMQDATPADLLKKTAMTLISTIGGTSGAIYGTAFMKMAGAASKLETIDLQAVSEILIAGLDGAKLRGEDTKIGDKTLIDAYEPAVYAFKEKIDAGLSLADALSATADAAEKGSDSTIDMIAKKGRASYLGERSIGHRDAGSYGIVVIAKAARDYVNT